MAELIRTQGYRTQVQNVPGAATPSVSFGQRRPEIAFQAQANYQNNIAQAIDRMSNTLFGLSETFGQEAGQQYVAEIELPSSSSRTWWPARLTQSWYLAHQ
jgi:hypothetical protein